MLKIMQAANSQWTTHHRTTRPMMPLEPPEGLQYHISICPQGRALFHPVAALLTDWATFECPTQTGQLWSNEKILEAVAQGPHKSALSLEALAYFTKEAAEKVRLGQGRIVNWDDIKDNPPTELKISPIAAILHKSKAFWSILDLSLHLRLNNGGVLVAVNDTTEKNAPKGAIDHIRKCLSWIVHTFAEMDINAKVFIAKWDIKGFCRMDCTKGEE
jgi:hypothetical protein